MKNAIFFVHGIGRHGEGWSTSSDGPATALNEAAKRYACFGGKPLADFVDLVEVRYDDLFDLVLAKWQELAQNLGPAASGLPWVATVSDLLTETNGNKKLFADFAGDVLLYKGFDLVARAVRLRVAAMIAGEVFRRNLAAQREGLEGTLPKVAIVAHSLGTAVATDALQTLISATFPADKATVQQRLPGEPGLVDLGEVLSDEQADKFTAMEGTASAAQGGPLPFFVDYLMLLANTTGIVSHFSGGYLSAKFQNDLQCKSITEVRHELDPIWRVKPFPMPARPEAATIDVKHLHEANVHGFAHYLSHPAVHARLFRAVVPGFKLADLREARRLAALPEWNGFGGKLAQQAEAKKADVRDRLEALLEQGDLRKLIEAAKKLRALA